MERFAGILDTFALPVHPTEGLAWVPPPWVPRGSLLELIPFFPSFKSKGSGTPEDWFQHTGRMWGAICQAWVERSKPGRDSSVQHLEPNTLPAVPGFIPHARDEDMTWGFC